MSLQVWLPLNGNLNNQGLANVSVTNNGATVDTNGKIGSCYKFNGSSIKVVGANIPISSWSLAVWVYITTSSSNGHQYLVGINTSTSTDFTAGLCWYHDTIGVHIADTTYLAPTSSALNNWYHVAATFNGTTLTLYLNGQSVASWDSPATPIQANDIYLGARGGNAGYFTGNLNDVRVYDHCLSPKEVKEISKGLVLHYPLNDEYISETSKVYDCSGYGRNGSVTASPTLVDSPRYSKGVKGNATITHTLFSMNKPFTVCYWVYLTTNGQTGSGKINITGNVSLYRDHDGVDKYTFSIRKTSGTTAYCTVWEPVTQGWHHLAYVCDSNSFKVYKDGVVSSYSYDVKDAWTAISLIQSNNTGLSDFRIYVTALSADDIKELYDTAGFIDNGQNIGSFQFIESDSQEINKNGQMLAAEFGEATNAAIYEDKIECNQLIEI